MTKKNPTICSSAAPSTLLTVIGVCVRQCLRVRSPDTLLSIGQVAKDGREEAPKESDCHLDFPPGRIPGLRVVHRLGNLGLSKGPRIEHRAEGKT